MRAQVNYVCMAGKLEDPGAKLSGAEAVVAASVYTHHLWKRVREIGGAYGSSFATDRSGAFYFSSFRDPQLRSTLAAYGDTPAFLAKWAQSMGTDDVKKAVLAFIGSLDHPISAKQKGERSFMEFVARETADDRAAFRKEARPLLAAFLPSQTLCMHFSAAL